MRFLANENFPREAVSALRNSGHDVAWMCVDGPGSPDDTVLARSVAEDRILLTFDGDFGELVYKRGASASAGVVYFRPVLSTPGATARFVVEQLGAPLRWQGHFTVVEPGHVRQRALPSPP